MEKNKINLIAILVILTLFVGAIGSTAFAKVDVNDNEAMLYNAYTQAENDNVALHKYVKSMEQELSSIRGEYNEEIINLMDRAIFIQEGKTYIIMDKNVSASELLAPPVYHSSGSSSSSTSTSTPGVEVCEICGYSSCKPNQIQTGTTSPDSCGCTKAICENIPLPPNPVPPNPNPQPQIKPDVLIKV